MKALIFTNGRYGDPDFYRDYLKKIKPSLIICADGGANFAKIIGVSPDVILGDMDSISDETLRYYKDVDIQRYPVCKDETDTQLAVNLAVSKGAKEIVIFGALGTRLDHSLGNIYLLTGLLEAGIQGEIVDENNQIFLVRGNETLALEIGAVVSLLPLGGPVEGINIKGFKYPIVNGKMTMDCPYGISNVTVLEKQSISIEKGTLLVDITRD